MKKMEYKTRQWHEKCFVCCTCKQPIGTKSFIPKEHDIYCAKCYEDKFATKCIKCNKVISIFTTALSVSSYPEKKSWNDPLKTSKIIFCKHYIQANTELTIKIDNFETKLE